MFKSIKNISLAGMAVITFAGCDGSNPFDIDDPIDVNLFERGIDFQFAAENPDLIAELPIFLQDSDTIEHGFIGTLDVRGFEQLDDGDINSAGELRVDNVSLEWERAALDPSAATFNLGPEHDFVGTEASILNQFETLMDQVIAAAEGTTNSVNVALNNNINEDTPQILVDAARSVGLLSSALPDNVARTVLDRFITYNATSSNQELVDTRTITGIYTFTDIYAFNALLSVEAGTATVFDQITFFFTTPPLTISREINDNGVIETGVFTLVLGD